jgi:Tfp pilus assembly protein PilF
VRRDPKFAEGYNNLGLVLLQSGEIHNAEIDFEEAIRIKPRYAEAHYNLALAFRQEGKNDEAQHAFDKAFAIEPELKNLPLP